MIENLNIKNYRMFRDFNISKLARINLIGGNNNCGKTSFLEAIRLLESKFDDSVLWDILASRGDEKGANDKMCLSLCTIGNNDNESHKKIIIGNLVLLMRFDKKNEYIQYINTYNNDEYERLLLQTKYQSSKKTINEGIFKEFLDREYINNFRPQSTAWIDDVAIYVPFTTESKKNDEFWKKISLTPREDDVLKILQIIEPKIKKFNIIEGNGRILIEGEDEPRPLKNLGDGANRILTIALALVNAKDKVLLIDEFEVGLHYSVQEQLWDIIFKYAKLWNIQVFVTTHSLDTLRSFSYVSDRYEGEGQYFRLSKSRQNAEIEAIIYEKETLQTAIDENYEPR